MCRDTVAALEAEAAGAAEAQGVLDDLDTQVLRPLTCCVPNDACGLGVPPRTELWTL
jgi:hypothetical protein